jgi:hypothetical protein
MSKSNPPVAKILIDLDEYLQLLKLKETVHSHEEEISKHYQNKEVNASPPITSAAEQKLGAGEQPPVDFANKLFQLLEQKYNLTPKSESPSSSSPQSSSVGVTQSGAGAEDLIESLPNQQTESEDPEGEAQTFIHNLPTALTIVKSKLNSDSANKELLRNIPEGYLTRAEKLLNALKEHTNDLTWDSAGVVFIDQKSLPESDINFLFPRLFRKVSNPDKIIHLGEIATKIASLGLGSLINRNLTAGTNRSKPMANHNDMKDKITKLKRWWYLGDA